MSAFLRVPETVGPRTRATQERVRDLFLAQPGLDRRAERLLRTAFDGSAIESRGTVISALDDAATGGDGVFVGPGRELLQPGTAARNDAYLREGTPLAVEAARRALAAAPDIDPAEITHLITVSCTGFRSPGPDLEIVSALGLRPEVQRYHLGFMGCAAAIQALRAAAQFCTADPAAVVLIVSLEVCTIHLRSSTEPDAIISSSLFADGAAAALVTGRPPAAAVHGAELDSFGTVVAAEGEEHMSWTIGDHGFEMVLSTAVPRVIGSHARRALSALCADDPSLHLSCEEETLPATARHWAIHPGGREILDRLQHEVGLSDAQLAPSRDVLRDHGNMSSATVLFVLRRILEGPDLHTGERIVAMAFGPGLTMEGAVLTALGGADAAS